MNIGDLYELCIDNDIEFLSHNRREGKIYFRYKGKYDLVSDYSVATIVQIFAFRNYEFTIPDGNNRYIVFDVGMNKGFSSMWFAMQDYVAKVIGYEINDTLKEFINENRELNKELFDKIDSHTFGLAGESGQVKLHYLPGDDGVSTMIGDFYTRYWSEKRKSMVKIKTVEVKKSSEEIRKYLDKFPQHKFILKIDVEGAEYEIFSDLAKNKLINEFDIILGETHSGFDDVKKFLTNFKIEMLQDFDNGLNTFLAFKDKDEI